MAKNLYSFLPLISRGVFGFGSLKRTYQTIHTTKFPSLDSNYIICLLYDFTLAKRSFSLVPNLAEKIKGDSFFEGSIFNASFNETSATYIKNNIIFTDSNISYNSVTNNFQGNFYKILQSELRKRLDFIEEANGNLIYTLSYDEIISHLKEMEKIGNLYAISEHNKNNTLNSDDFKVKYHIYYLSQIPTYVELNYLHTKDV